MQQQLYTIINYDFWLKVFLFFAPILWFPGITQNGIQTLFFNYGSLVLFCISLCGEKCRESRNPSLLVIALVSIFVSVFINYKAYPLNLISIISGIMLYYSIVTSLKDIYGAVRILMLIAGINIFVSILQMMGFGVIYTPYIENGSIQTDHFSLI